eukprot:Selendium_serpulae@DN6316_c2_g4_i1.p1
MGRVLSAKGAAGTTTATYDVGPSGVNVSLFALGDNKSGDSSEPLSTAITTEGGHYALEGVLPGHYRVVASHSSWKMGVSEGEVSVEIDAPIVDAPLSVDGYDVRGTVETPTSDSKALLDGLVAVLLQPSDGQDADVDVSGLRDSHCSVNGGASLLKDIPTDWPSTERHSDVLCVARVGLDNGGFKFEGVPAGRYEVMVGPTLRESGLAVETTPKVVVVGVTHGSAALSPITLARVGAAGRVVRRRL